VEGDHWGVVKAQPVEGPERQKKAEAMRKSDREKRTKRADRAVDSEKQEGAGKLVDSLHNKRWRLVLKKLGCEE